MLGSGLYIHIYCAVDAVKLYFTLDMLLLSVCFIYTGILSCSDVHASCTVPLFFPVMDLVLGPSS